MVYTGKIQPAKKKNRSRHTLLTFKMRDYSRYCFRLSFKCDLFVGYYCYHYLLHSFWNPSEMKCGWNDGLEVGLMIWLDRILFQDILSVNRCTICVELFDLWQFSQGMARNQIYTQNMYYMCVIHSVCVCALFDNEIPFEYRTTDQRNAFHIQHLYWFRFVSVCCFYACNFFFLFVLCFFCSTSTLFMYDLTHAINSSLSLFILYFGLCFGSPLDTLHRTQSKILSRKMFAYLFIYDC